MVKLTKAQQEYWDALVAAGAKEKCINVHDVELRLKRAGVTKERGAIYMGLRRLARKDRRLVITAGVDGGYQIMDTPVAGLEAAARLRRVK